MNTPRTSPSLLATDGRGNSPIDVRRMRSLDVGLSRFGQQMFDVRPRSGGAQSQRYCRAAGTYKESGIDANGSAESHRDKRTIRSIV